jgi:alkylated DNA repair protein (DNA oxidative demethylase)
VVKLHIAPDVILWRAFFLPSAQQALLAEVLELLEIAPLYRPVMPKTGKPFSVEESNFGALGWVSDKSGYRYQKLHPVTGEPWPKIPHLLLQLWAQTGGGRPPDCCLVNLYRAGARMGLHQDRDENDLAAPVIGVSLGDDALFRIGGVSRSAPTRTVRLASGDVVRFGGTARLAFHGIDRVVSGSSRLVPGGGRLSLTLRRVKL